LSSLFSCKQKKNELQNDSEYAFPNTKDYPQKTVDQKGNSKSIQTSTGKKKSKNFVKLDLNNSNFSFCDPAAPDTLRLKKTNNEYIEILLDSLSQRNDVSRLSIYDYNQKDLVLYISFHIGNINVDQIKNGVYKITSYSNLPIKGDWDGKWKKHKLIEYIFDTTKEDFTLHTISNPFEIVYDKSDFREIKDFVRTNKSCIPINQYISEECSKQIEVFEYYLFLSILGGEKKYIKEYLELEEKYANSFGGQYAEYLSGNYMTLLMLKKISLNNDLVKGIIPVKIFY